MGVSWFLKCIKCEEIVDKLREIQQEDEYEPFMESVYSQYYFGDPGQSEIDVDKLVQWLQKHRKHGRLFFNGA